GFLAAGGDAGREAAAGENRRQAARRRARAARRDDKMLRRGGRGDGDQSERAAHVCVCEWLRRSTDRARNERARELMGGRPDLRDLMPADEKAALSEPVIARVCARMDELSARWASLAVGESFAIEWRPRRRPRSA